MSCSSEQMVSLRLVSRTFGIERVKDEAVTKCKDDIGWLDGVMGLVQYLPEQGSVTI